MNYVNHDKMYKSLVLLSSDKLIFITFFFGHIKVSKDSSAKYYKNTRGLKKLMEGMKIFLNKRKTRISMVVRNIKISQKMKSKG